jgi:hypothetical protein
MLSACIVLFFLILSLSSPAQGKGQPDEAEMLRHREFQFVVECPVYSSSLSGEATDTSLLIAPSGSRFILIDWLNERAVIRFILRAGHHRLSKNLSPLDEEPDSYRYFTISQSHFLFKARPLSQSRYALSLGNIISPLKIRLLPFDFSRDLMIGSTIGLRYQPSATRTLSCNLLLGLGLSQNSIDSFSTNGKVRNPADVLTFTPSLGCVVEFGQAQLGLFTGWDVMAHNNSFRKEWIYSRQPWLGLGVGYAIFSFQGKD